MMDNKNVKIGIYGAALLMMGVIGVSGSLSTIAASFPNASQTMVQNIVSIPCLVIIPVTLMVGRLMAFISKKKLMLTGIGFFIVGGVVPAFLDSLPLILVFRGILGLGIGLIQPVASALVAENYQGPEQERVQGAMTSYQMLGCAVMVFVGGWLGARAWNLSFYVHLLGIISLMMVIAFVPDQKPVRKEATDAPHLKNRLTLSSWRWAGMMFLFFIAGQIYSVYTAFLVTEKALGTAVQAGNSLAFFALGGFMMGLLFGRLVSLARQMTLSMGFFLLGISYLLVAFANSMTVIYIGSIICGLAFSTAMPCIIINTAGSVDHFSVGMAISITMCAQNLAQFISPMIVNPLLAAISSGNPNQMAFILGAVLITTLGVAALFWGTGQNKKAAQTG